MAEKPVIRLPNVPKNIPPDLDLVSTVMHLRTHRRDAVRAYHHEMECRKQAEITRRFPEALRQAQAEYDERYDAYSKEIRERTYPARAKRRLALAKWQRELPKPMEKMTGPELWDEVEHAVEREMAGKGFKFDEDGDETWEEFKDRIDIVIDQVMPFVYEEKMRLRGDKVLYVEGIPRNVIHGWKAVVNFIAIYIPKSRLATKYPPCLQCTVKGMECSQTRQYLKRPVFANCDRCRRNGDRCLVRRPRRRDKRRNWHFGDSPDEKGEQLDEAVGVWLEKRQQGMKALPMWHKNDADENKKDSEYKDKKWWKVLKDPTTRW